MVSGDIIRTQTTRNLHTAFQKYSTTAQLFRRFGKFLQKHRWKNLLGKCPGGTSNPTKKASTWILSWKASVQNIQNNFFQTTLGWLLLHT